MADYNLGTARGKAEIDSSDVRSASKELKNADIVLRQSGASLINFGQQALAAFGYVVGIGAQFEKEMDFVQAVSGATEAEMESLTAKAVELGKSGPFGPVALAASFVELAKAGITAKEIVDGVGESVVNLAGAADITADQAGEIVVQVMSIFGLAAEEVPRATDIIAGAANASLIDVQDFATSLKYAGPVASALGVDLEDLATTIALLGQSGIKGSTAGTSLRQTMLNLAGATPKAIDRMKELGIITEDGSNIFYDAQGNVKDLTTVFELLGDKLDGLTQKEKGEALRDIFGVRQLPSILFLMEQGRAKFEEMNAEINNTTAADVMAKRLDNLDGSIKRFKATLESVLLGPSGPFQQMLKDIVDLGTQLLQWFDELPPSVKTFIVGSLGMIGVLAVLSGAFLLTVGNIVRMVRVMAELSGLAVRVIPALAGIVQGVWALTAALLANPAVLIILAIIALAAAFYLLYTRVEGFRNFVNNFGEEVKKIWGKVADFFSGPFVDAVSGAFDKVKGFVSNFFQGLSLNPLDNLKKLWDSFWDAGFGGEGITTEVTNIFGIMERLGVKFFQAFEDVKNKVLEIYGSIKKTLGKIPGIFERAFERAALGAVNAFLDFFDDFPAKVGYIIGFVIGRFIRLHIDLVKQMVETGTDVVKTAIGWGQDLFNWAKNLGLSILTAIINELIALPGQVMGIFTSVLNFLISIVPQMINLGWQLGSGVFNAIWGFISRLPGEIGRFLAEGLQKLINFVPQFLAEAINIGNNIFSGIIDIITGIPGKMLEILLSVISTIKNKVLDAKDAAFSFGKGLLDGFLDGIDSHSPSGIERALTAIDDQADSTSKNLARTVRNMGLTANPLIAGINSGTAGVGSGASGAGYMTWNQNAPLVGQFTARDDRDVDRLAEQLEERQNNRLAAAGLREVK